MERLAAMTEVKRAFSFGTDRDVDETDPGAAPEPVVISVNERLVECAPMVDGLKMLVFMSRIRDPKLSQARATAIVEWLQECVVDWPAFQELSADLNLRIEDLAEIAGTLADEYADRPTKSPAPSAAGRSTTGSSSEGSSGSAD